MADNENNENNNRRSGSAIFDPKMLAMLIPLFITATSGFLFYERTLAEMKITVGYHTQQLASLDLHNHENFKRWFESQLDLLKYRISEIEGDDADFKRFQKEIQTLVDLLGVQAGNNANDVIDLQNRLRTLTREVDRMSK
jgi:hypothetical protein